MLIVFWCTTSNTVLKVLWKMCVEPVIAHACWWPCTCLKCVRKNLEFFEVHTCHWPGAQIWFRYKWKKLVTASVLLYCVEKCNSLQYWKKFFLSCVSGFRSKFSRIAQWRKRLQLDSRSDLTTNGLILGILLRNAFLRWLHICMDWNLHELLSCFSFLTTSNFFDV